MLAKTGSTLSWRMWIHIDRDKLLRATQQVEVLADWLQEQIYAR